MTQKQYFFNYEPEFDFEKLDASMFEQVGVKIEENERITSKPYSYWKTVGKLLITNKTFIISALLLLLVIMLSIVVPIGEIARPIVPEFEIDGPSADHWFGIGLSGEDFWNTIWIGTRTTLLFALAISSIQILLGILIGSIWGYNRKFDILFIEITRFLNLVPTLILWLIIIFMFEQSGVTSNIFVIIFAVSITSWIAMAEIIRVQIILVRNTEYNIASSALGTPGTKIVTRNIFPKILPIIIQTSSFAIPGAIAIDSTLNYFNFGFISNRSQTSLGYILNEVLAKSEWESYPHLIIIPVAIIGGISAIFFLAGKVFADSLDPKTHR